MKTHIRILAILLFLPIAAFAVETPENTLAIWTKIYLRGDQSKQPPIELNARAGYEGNEPILKFKLTNTSNQDVSINDMVLPWTHSHNITLAAFSPAGRRLSNMYHIDDPMGGKVHVIRPGESLEGNYQLLDAIVFDSRSETEDKIILWEYHLWDHSTNKTSKPQLIAGVVVLPAKQKK